MRHIGFPLTAIAAVPFLAGHWCEQETLVVDSQEDSGADVESEAMRDADSSESVAQDADSSGLRGGGPLTFVVDRIELVTDRVCDFDGDEIADNAVADLGVPDAEILAATVTASLQMQIEGGRRTLFHSPWVEDRATPDDESIRWIAFGGEAADLCFTGEANPADDFSGAETFCAELEYLDDCGEPLWVSTEAAIRRGELAGHFDRLDLYLPLREAGMAGTVSAGGRSAEVVTCAFISVRDVGAHYEFLGAGDLSTLEVFVGGGSVRGVPTVAGVEPDLDLDGDGLERMMLDQDGRVSACIDGDGTVIEGRDCWDDERLADGFSLSFALHAVPAHFVGDLEPGHDERECGDVLPSIRGFGGTHSERVKVDDVCPSERSLLVSVLDCVAAECPEVECAPGGDECRTCAAERCPDELAGCVDAPPCCLAPPEGSAWDQN